MPDPAPSVGEPSPRRRPSPWRICVPLVFGLAGLLFAATANVAHGSDLRGGFRADLPDLIRAQQREVDRQARSVAGLRDEVADLSRRRAAGDQAVTAVLDGAKDAAASAQVGAVHGSGLRVVLDDAPTDDPAGLPADVVPDDLVVHQQDLQGVVNALWAGGAEALQLMDQRVVATSAVRCVGNVLLLQGRTYPPPYTVTAIGNPESLRAALDASPSVQAYRYYVDHVRLGWEVATEKDVTLPAYDGPLALEHATVATP